VHAKQRAAHSGLRVSEKGGHNADNIEAGTQPQRSGGVSNLYTHGAGGDRFDQESGACFARTEVPALRGAAGCSGSGGESARRLKPTVLFSVGISGGDGVIVRSESWYEMKRKTSLKQEPVIAPEILAEAKRSLMTDKLKKPGKCSVCGAETAGGPGEPLCWVCRRLKISAWRDSEQQMPAQE
jgi:hypothetical protein